MYTVAIGGPVDEPSNISLYEEAKEQNEQFSDLNLESENSITESLYKSRRRLYDFVRKVQTLSDEAIDFSKIYCPFKQRLTDTAVTGEEILQLASSTIRKMSTNNKIKKNWNREDIIIMLWVVHQYQAVARTTIDYFVDSDWVAIASLIPAKTAEQCRFRFLGMKRCSLAEYPWTPSYDQLLRTLVTKYAAEIENVSQSIWHTIARYLYLKSRSGGLFRTAKQCREHWISYLDPRISKGPWNREEDLKLLCNFLKVGKKWAQIARVLNGRTYNAIKNRFNLLMQKRIANQSHFRMTPVEYAEFMIHKLKGKMYLSESQSPNLQSENNKYNVCFSLNLTGVKVEDRKYWTAAKEQEVVPYPVYDIQRVMVPYEEYQCDMNADYFMHTIQLAIDDEPSAGYYWFGNHIE